MEGAAYIGGGIAIVGAVGSLYARASMADHDTAIAVMQSELRSLSKRTDENYRYCHEANHDTRDLVSDLDARFKLAEYRLGRDKP